MKKLLLSIFVLTFLVCHNASAENQINLENLSTYQTSDYTGLNKTLQDLEDQIKSGKVSKEEMVLKANELTQTASVLEEYKGNLSEELVSVEKKLELLGEAPKDDQKEDDVVSKTRAEFSNKAIDIKGKIKTTEILIAKTDDLNSLIFNQRNKELLGNLLLRQEPLIYPTEFFNSGRLFAEFLVDILTSPFQWYDNLDEEKQIKVENGLFPVLLFILLSLWIGVYLRMFIIRHFGYKKDVDSPRYGNKVSAAVFVAIAYGVIPASIVGGFLVWNITHNVITSGFFGLIINSLLFYGLFVILAKAVARVVFAPYNEKWRLINVSTEKAKKITSALYFTVIMLGIMAFLDHIVREAHYPVDLLSFVSSMGAAIKAFCIVLIAKRLFWEEAVQTHDIDDELDEELDDDSFGMAFKVTFALSVFALATFLLSIFGYPSLATFILDKFIATFIIASLFFIVRKAVKEILHRFLFLRFWSKTFRLKRRAIQKVDFWLVMLLEPLFAVTGLFLVLTVWGVSTSVLIKILNKLLFGFTVGGIKISFISIVLGLLIFFLSIALVKIMKKKLMSNVLSRMDIDDGIKHSLESGFGFLGFVLAVLLAVVVMGGSLTNFALVAGALSFGIGLGLQNIVNNFVSGIVLLFERPAKIGDWVIINGQEGIVKQVSIRATELETWEKSNIIIPNADILSNSLVNLTHTDKVGRIEIKVGVAYGSDTNRVKEILHAVAENHKKILKKPAPLVFFMDFGDSSLNFELRAYISDVMNRLAIASELRFEIDRMFREEGIEIPFPQRTLHFQTPIRIDHE